MCLPVRCVVLLSVASLMFPASSGDSLESVRNSHRASRESIYTCSCKVDFRVSFFKEPEKKRESDTCSGQFHYGPNAASAKVIEHGVRSEYVITNGVKKTLFRSDDGKRTSAGLQKVASPYVARCDAYAGGLLVLGVPESLEFLPFERFAERADRITSVARKDNLVVVGLFFDRKTGKDRRQSAWDVEVSFDPSVNYLVRKVVYAIAGTTYRRTAEVVSFKEHAPGVYFPEKAVSHSTDSAESVATFSEVKINQPLPDGTFTLLFPKGVPLGDRISGTYYRVDARGNPISEKKALRTLPPPSSGTLPPISDTLEEPSSLTRFILPVSLGLLAVAGVVAYVRHRQRRLA